MSAGQDVPLISGNVELLGEGAEAVNFSVVVHTHHRSNLLTASGFVSAGSRKQSERVLSNDSSEE